MIAWLGNACRLLGRMLETRPPDVVTVYDDRFEVRHGAVSRFEVAWDRVATITAFKLDCGTYDLVCVGFVLTRLPDRTYVVDEEAVGFESLVEEMQRRCPPTDPDWRSKVTFPPFVATNEMTLWRREEPPA